MDNNLTQHHLPTAGARRLAVLVICLGAACAFAQASPPIEKLVDDGALPGMLRPDFRPYQASLREFYTPAAYAPAWFQGTKLSAQAESMIQLFENAWRKGLEPDDYDASRWSARRSALERSGGAATADFDLALTVSAMRYVSDLRIGRVNPKHVGFDLTVDKKKYDLAQFLRQQLLKSADVAALIDAIEPPFAAYRRTEQALARYIELARSDGAPTLPVPARTVAPGDEYAGLAALVQFLERVGDLPPPAAGGTAAERYGGEVVEGVKRFQRRHGLDDDGRLGAATIKAMNVPLAARVQQLQLALERWRWVPEEFAAPPIVVNIPDFRLRAFEANEKVALSMRVVVGKAMVTQSPVFTRDMTYVVFRPYWVVPPGIMRRSILPAIQKDRDYLAKNRYEVTTPDGRVATSGTISDEMLAQLRAGKLMVRQKPGPNNALGLVKLMFPNEYAVYLHSTPATELFARTRRDFSSGCIRVEKPAELTVWTLRNNSGWTLERVQSAMQSGPDNVTVRLTQPIPVFIVYTTAIAYPDGEVHFYDDIYGHDRRLTEALAKAERGG
jgi:L,D-transpeptidase YcbB